MKKERCISITTIALMFFTAALLVCPQAGWPAEKAGSTILVYSGAGIRKPMDELGRMFEQQYGIKVRYNYAGSGHLLSQIELSKTGDIYQPGATYYLSIAKKKGFIDYEKFAAYHVPVIAVPKGNPANITCLKDLAKPGLRIALGDPKACAIGKLGNKILKKNRIKDAVDKNVITRAVTVNELIVAISMGQVDAAITWEESVLFASHKTHIIKIPGKQNIIKIIPIGRLTFSENKDDAAKFVDFVTSDKGKAIYKKHGFTPYPDPKYQ
ncbi:MAG: molybdate transport system substrate-binding protein [Desulfobacteraceae bacterium Eth-SRB1]|nr:MAG: molybdate transport system substrate-binding protein [Desulfobacteraceae bacterium Eth-SRB1]